MGSSWCRPVVWLALLAGVGGCARFEFDLIEPPDLAQRIGRQSAVTVSVAPLRYSLKSVDGRLEMLIFNPTDQAITFRGTESAAVSAGGQSHPLPSFTIAPQSHGRLVIPPIRTTTTSSGPRVSMGVGMSSGSRGMSTGVGARTGSPSRTTMSDGGIMFWDWQGETDVRLLLRYTDGTKDFEQTFVFGRRRA